MAFFGRNYDILYVFADGHQGACFHIIISAVHDQIFEGGSGFWKHLYFIENNQRISLIELLVVVCRQIHKQMV